MIIRKAEVSDHDQLWEIINQVISKGDTYVFAPDSSREKMIGFWCSLEKHTYVAIQQDRVVGTYFIKANQPDLGSHVANAGYMTLPSASGQGIGYRMGLHSLEEAKRLGFKSMQSNIVVKSNQGAVYLWKKLEFEIVGELPEVFDHPELGLTNAYVMWRKL